VAFLTAYNASLPRWLKRSIFLPQSFCNLRLRKGDMQRG
jgi:hypothetical protein